MASRLSAVLVWLALSLEIPAWRRAESAEFRSSLAPNARMASRRVCPSSVSESSFVLVIEEPAIGRVDFGRAFLLRTQGFLSVAHFLHAWRRPPADTKHGVSIVAHRLQALSNLSKVRVLSRWGYVLVGFYPRPLGAVRRGSEALFMPRVLHCVVSGFGGGFNHLALGGL